MTITEVISVINLIGLATLLPIGVSLLTEKNKRKFEARQKFKEERYRVIFLLAYHLINYEKDKLKFITHRPDLDSKEKLIDELNTEWVYMALFASDNTIRAMKRFTNNYNEDTFRELALAMRKELFGIRTNIKSVDLDYFNQQ